MAIDADLNAGLIDDKEAQRRRRELRDEAVADRELGEDVGGGAERQAVPRRADDDAAEDVDREKWAPASPSTRSPASRWRSTPISMPGSSTTRRRSGCRRRCRAAGRAASCR
jgi:hypothetical protein